MKRKVPVLSFGNSSGDSAMHNFCLSNSVYKTAAFMLIADDEARDHANREKALKLGSHARIRGLLLRAGPGSPFPAWPLLFPAPALPDGYFGDSCTWRIF